MNILAKVTLPWPPSVNHYWKIGQRKVKKANGSVIKVGCLILGERGRAYRDFVAAAVWKQCKGKPLLQGTLRVTVGANPPTRALCDLDNLNKGILDGLQHAGLYVNDGQIDDLRTIRLPVCPPKGRVRVIVEPMYAEPLFARAESQDGLSDDFLSLFDRPDGVAPGAEPGF